MEAQHHHQQSSDRAHSSAKQAWARLQDLKLTATPEHYALFFAYYSGQDQALIKAVDAVLADPQVDSELKREDALLDIHGRFLNVDNQQAFVTSAANKFDEEMKQIMGAIEATRKGADDYGTALDAFSHNLDTDASAEQIRYMVTQMALETRSIAEQNNKLHEQLNSSSSQINSLQNNLETIRKESLSDPLTGIGNRKAFVADLARITEETIKHGDTLSLLMIDVDHFKNFNDLHGHLVGDQVLKLVAHTLKENIKGRDTAARWGGEEFAILLPQTKLEDAVRVGDHLRKLVASKKIIRKPQNEDLGAITLSMGATQYIYGEDTALMVERADQALYSAKQSGRNRVMAAAQPVDQPSVQHPEPVPEIAAITIAE